MAQWASTIFNNRRPRNGFTIVELLIVVVVIAILAAITVVSYNGIQSRAKTAAVQDTLTQSFKKLRIEKIKAGTGLYPVSLPSEIRSGGNITLNYYPLSSAAPTSYCLEAVSGNIWYHITSSSSGPELDGCSVTNLVIDPRPSSGYWFASSNSVASLSFVTWPDGSPAAKSTRKDTANYALYSNRNSSKVATAQEGDVYTVLFSIRSSVDTTVTFQVGSGTATASIGSLNYPVTLKANEVQNIRYTFTIPSGYDGDNIFNKFYWTDGKGAIGDSFEVANVMWVKGNYTGSFKYGDSPGWSWDGTPNNSTSTGPAS